LGDSIDQGQMVWLEQHGAWGGTLWRLIRVSEFFGGESIFFGGRFIFSSEEPFDQTTTLAHLKLQIFAQMSNYAPLPIVPVPIRPPLPMSTSALPPPPPPPSQPISALSSQGPTQVLEIMSEDEEQVEQAINPHKSRRGRPRKVDRVQQGPMASVPTQKKTTLTAQLKQRLQEMESKHQAIESKQATMEKTLDETREAIKCMVCYSTMYRPTTLSCGHSACALCLYMNEEITNKCDCPACRLAHSDVYKINVTLQTIIRVMKSLQ